MEKKEIIQYWLKSADEDFEVMQRALTAERAISTSRFFDADEIDGFEEDALLMKLRRKVDLAIEPHAFARKDFDEADPFVNEIITTGKRIA